MVVVPYLICCCPLTREFAKEKDRVESRAGFLLLKEEQKLEREMNGYMNWICKAGESQLAIDVSKVQSVLSFPSLSNTLTFMPLQRIWFWPRSGQRKRIESGSWRVRNMTVVRLAVSLISIIKIVCNKPAANGESKPVT